jgi:hypothetical protein
VFLNRLFIEQAAFVFAFNLQVLQKLSVLVIDAGRHFFFVFIGVDSAMLPVKRL